MDECHVLETEEIRVLASKLFAERGLSPQEAQNIAYSLEWLNRHFRDLTERLQGAVQEFEIVTPDRYVDEAIVTELRRLKAIEAAARAYDAEVQIYVERVGIPAVFWDTYQKLRDALAGVGTPTEPPT